MRLTLDVTSCCQRRPVKAVHVPSGKYRQTAGKIHTLSYEVAPVGRQNARTDTSRGGLKRRQQQKWTEGTSTAQNAIPQGQRHWILT
ncbi:hypothetical protein ElyMa_000334800 [Elysia marginata]|uniref:Uncharacterized protein n=1 Tax=Elysia marginata TaxID=1093978 RepID=A0AAV4FCK0_9GAST|nr:hypothetical protein ElyMa_000334800 [Elysia marginata]